MKLLQYLKKISRDKVKFFNQRLPEPFKPFPQNPRVAVQISGHLRTYEACAPSLRRYLLDKYDCDIFMHTWNFTDHNSKAWHNRVPDRAAVSNDIKAKITDLYAPKSLEIESEWQDDNLMFFGTNKDVKISLTGVKSALYSKARANYLRVRYSQSVGARYDIVVFIRPDILIKENLEIDELSVTFSDDVRSSVHYAQNSSLFMVGNSWVCHYGAIDAFHVCLPEVANSIADLPGRFSECYVDFLKSLPDGISSPEIAFHEALIRQSIRPRIRKLDYAILRSEK